MRSTSILAIIAASTLEPVPSKAACPANAMHAAATAQVRSAVVGRLESLFGDALHFSAPIPMDSVNVMPCPTGGVLSITSLSGQAQVAATSPTFTLGQDTVHLDASVVLTAEASVRVDLCGQSAPVCQVHFSAHNVELSTDVIAAVHDCTPAFALYNLSLVPDPYENTITFDNCGALGTDLTVVANAYRDYLVGLLTKKATDAAQTAAPAALTSLSSDLFAAHFTKDGIALELAVEDLHISPQGILADIAIAATPAGGPATCLPPGAQLPPAPMAPSTRPALSAAAPVSVGFSPGFLQRLMDVAWYSGQLCFSNEDLGQGLSGLFGTLAAGTTAGAVLTPSSAPQVQLSGTPGTLIVKNTFDDLKTSVTMTSPGSAPMTWVVTMSATLNMQMSLDPTSRTLALTPAGVDVTSLSIEEGTVDEQFDAQNIFLATQNVIMPAFARTLAGLPVVGDVLKASGLAARLLDVGDGNGFAIVDLDVSTIDPNDQVPPTTHLDGATPAIVAGTFSIPTASTDNVTAAAYLRHLVTVDGVQSDPPQSGAALLIGPLCAGNHTVLVQALDLTGNLDPVGTRVDLLVDDQAPVVTMTDAPLSPFRGETVSLTFSALDDHTATAKLSYRYTAGLVTTLSMPDAPLSSGSLDQSGALTLANLPDQSKIRVTVFAKDAVGNEGTAQAIFTVDRSSNSVFSCQAGCCSPLVLILAALYVGLLWRRRARHAEAGTGNR